MSYIWYILIGLVAGFLTGRSTKKTGSELITFIVVGILGGLLGGWFFSLLVTAGILGNLITATLVAILFLSITAYFTKGSSSK